MNDCMTVVIYTGLGVSSYSKEQATFFVSDVYDVSEVFYLDENTIHKLSDHKDAVDLFIVPGGSTTDFLTGLEESGILAILDYVSSGGLYLGFCGGAYLGAHRVCFKTQKGDQLFNLENERPFKFYEGLKTGPIGEQFSYCSNVGYFCQPAETAEGDLLYAYMNGAGYFAYAENLGEEVLLTYKDGKAKGEAAVVRTSFGQGMVILCSPHLEYSWVLMEADEYLSEEDIQKYRQNDQARLAFWKKHLPTKKLL